MTFFSSAARIWSQGLRAEVGVVANAILQSLRSTGGASDGSFADDRQRSSTGREAAISSRLSLLTDYLYAAGLPLQDSAPGRLSEKIRNAECSKSRLEIS